MAELNEIPLDSNNQPASTGDNTVPSLAPVRDAIGASNAAIADAGGEGSVSAKMRRLTQQMADLSKAEDAGHVSGDLGIQALAVRKNTSTTGLGADGDYAPLAVDSNGRLYVTTNGSVAITAINGGVSDNASGSGVQPLMGAAQYNSSAPTYDNGDLAKLQADVNGRLLVVDPVLNALISSGALLVKLDPSTVNANGRAPPSGSAPVVLASEQRKPVAASQTAETLGAAGAIGDYLSGVLIVPATTSPGAVTILDDDVSMNIFAGGSDSVSNLIPFFVPVGAASEEGAWKITTGANVSVIAFGNFTES